MNPPCPGIRLLDCFTPLFLFKRLKVISPTKEIKVTKKPKKRNSIMFKSKLLAIVARHKGVINNAEINPSMVLPGLIFGRIFLFPKSLPEK